jgi:hypothetical protein
MTVPAGSAIGFRNRKGCRGTCWSSHGRKPTRLWVPFQRNGVVTTAHFDIPVKRAAIEASAN